MALALSLGGNPPGATTTEGLQGRYYLPLAITLRRQRGAAWAGLSLAIAGLIAVASQLCLLAVARPFYAYSGKRGPRHAREPRRPPGLQKETDSVPTTASSVKPLIEGPSTPVYATPRVMLPSTVALAPRDQSKPVSSLVPANSGGASAPSV